MPPVASCRRGISARAVDLPAPDAPTSAMVMPGSATKDRPRSPVRPIGIGELHLLEDHPPAPRRQRQRTRALGNAPRLVDDGEHAGQPRHPLLHRRVQRAERPQGLGRDQQGRDEAGEIADGVGAHGARATRQTPSPRQWRRRPTPPTSGRRRTGCGSSASGRGSDRRRTGWPALPRSTPAGRRGRCGPERSSPSAGWPPRPSAPACHRRPGGCACRGAGWARPRGGRAQRR